MSLSSGARGKCDESNGYYLKGCVHLLLATTRHHLGAVLAIIAKQLEQYKMLSQDAQYIKEDRQLTAALIDRLIDRVEVSREKRITVRFRFQSEFEHCEEVLSQCRNM